MPFLTRSFEFGFFFVRIKNIVALIHYIFSVTWYSLTQKVKVQNLMNQSVKWTRRLHRTKRRWWSCTAFPITFDPDWWLTWGGTYWTRRPTAWLQMNLPLAPRPLTPTPQPPPSSVNGAVTRERKSLESWATHDSVKSCVVLESREKVS